MGGVFGEIVAGVLGEAVAGEAVAGAAGEAAAGAVAGEATAGAAGNIAQTIAGAVANPIAAPGLIAEAVGGETAGNIVTALTNPMALVSQQSTETTRPVNPLAKLSFSWDNAGRAFKDAGSRALNSTSEGRALSTLYNGGDVNMDSFRSAAVQYGTDKLGEALGKHGKGGQMVAAAIGLGANKSKEEEDSAKDDKAAVEVAANPARHGVYGQFGAAPPVQVPRQAAPQFNMIDYFNSLMGENNGRYQA